MSDPEILARLIYRAYIAPDPRAPLEAEALLPFRAVLDLYARTVNRCDTVTACASGCYKDTTPFETEASACDADACPVELPEEPEQTAADCDGGAADKLDGFEPVPLRAHDTHTHTRRWEN